MEKALDQAMLGQGDNVAGKLRVRLACEAQDAKRSVQNIVLHRYAVATQHKMRGSQFASIAVDASRVGRRNVLHAAVALPDNSATWAPPQALWGGHGQAARVNFGAAGRAIKLPFEAKQNSQK